VQPSTVPRASNPVVGVLVGADREAFAAYVASRSAPLLRTAFLLAGDRQEAEDLLQTALSRLALAWHRVREREALDAYVRRTMLRELLSLRRRRRVTALLVAELPEAPTELSGVDAETRLLLWQGLRRLPPRQRAAVVLRYVDDLTEVETAAVLGCAVGTVKSQTSRALATLRADTGLRDLNPSRISPPEPR